MLGLAQPAFLSWICFSSHSSWPAIGLAFFVEIRQFDDLGWARKLGVVYPTSVIAFDFPARNLSFLKKTC